MLLKGWLEMYYFLDYAIFSVSLVATLFEYWSGRKIKGSKLFHIWLTIQGIWALIVLWPK